MDDIIQNSHIEKIYIERKLETEIKRVIDSHTIAVISGPRQSGKSTLLRHLAKQFRTNGAKVFTIDGEYPEQWETLFDVEKMSSIIDYLPPEQEVYILLDEIQKIENSGSALKRMYDRLGHRIKFIATGSVFLWGEKGIGEYLTGRALETKLFPFSLVEIAKFITKTTPNRDDLYKYYLAFSKEIESIWNHTLEFGLFPKVFIQPEKNKEIALESIAQGYIKRDIFSILPRGDWSFFQSLLQILASEAGILNMSRIGRELGRDVNTVDKYIDSAKELFLVRHIRNFVGGSLRAELRKSPRILFVDTGILHLVSNKDVSTGTIIEQAVGAEIWKSGYEMRHWRTKSGAEVDFVIGKNIPIEVKKGHRGYRISPGFRSFLKRYRPPIAFWLQPGKQEVRKIENTDVYIMPAPMFVLGLQTGAYKF